MRGVQPTFESRQEAVESREAVRLLDVDPDLAGTLSGRELTEARRALVVPTVTVPRGEWAPRQVLHEANGCVGVLLIRGYATREVAVAKTVSAELVGPCDLLRPWDHSGAAAPIPFDVRWHVLDDTKLALLGRSFTAVAARWPQLMSAFIARAVGRAESLALALAVSSTTGLERRLLILFWHLADRWGKVRHDGVLVPVPLTHERIARLVGARRPSVSMAVSSLERQGLIERLVERSWLLPPQPPGDLVRMTARHRSAAHSERNGRRAHLSFLTLTDT